MKIGFWRVSDQYGMFSNWWLCEFIYKDTKFISSEQALMWSKADLFGDEEIKNKILNTADQKEIKHLGRLVKNYNDRIWAVSRYDIMVDILKEKFKNEFLKTILLQTGDAELYEASPLDAIWGIGSSNVENIKGLNLLGKALMEVREYYLKES